MSFVVGDGSRILFWHDKWTGDNSLKSLYPQLFVCSANKEACISEVLSPLVGDNDRVWSLRFYREFNDWELAASYSLLHFIQTRIPRGEGSDRLFWCLNGSGKFDVRFFYNKIRNATRNLVLGCLMWNIWTERNRRSFEDTGKSLDQLLELCRRTLFDWSRCWGLSDCSTITDFLLSLSIA